MDYGYNELIQAGYDFIPSRIAEHLHPDFFTGTNPIYAGLESDKSLMTNGESPTNSAHFCCRYLEGTMRFIIPPTIVLPEPPHLLYPIDIVHELGHVLESIFNFDFYFDPISDYAKVHIYDESFAEAFCYYVCYDYNDFPVSKELDREINSFFNGLWNW